MNARYLTDNKSRRGGENMLAGKRTYIVAVVLFVAGGLRSIGYLDEGTYQTLFNFLVPAGLVTLRMGMK